MVDTLVNKKIDFDLSIKCSPLIKNTFIKQIYKEKYNYPHKNN